MPHPTSPFLLVTAGYDGKVALLDLSSGTVERCWNNLIREAEGPINADLAPGDPVRLLDGAMSPDGLRFALGDGCGRLILFAADKPPLWTATPAQQFFESDYGDLRLDAHGGVIDAESQLPPHLSPRGAFCNFEFTPHPRQPLPLPERSRVPQLDASAMENRRKALDAKAAASSVLCACRLTPQDRSHALHKRNTVGIVTSPVEIASRSHFAVAARGSAKPPASRWVIIDTEDEDEASPGGNSTNDEEFTGADGAQESDIMSDGATSDDEEGGRRPGTRGWSSRRKTEAGGSGGPRRTGRLRANRRFKARQGGGRESGSGSDEGYREMDTDESLSADSDNLMENVRLLHSERDRAERLRRRGEKMAELCAKQPRGAKGKCLKKPDRTDEPSTKPDVFYTAIRVTAPDLNDFSSQEDPSAPSSSSSSAFSSLVSSSTPVKKSDFVDRAVLVCALCGRGHGDATAGPLPGRDMGAHPLILGTKRVWVHDMCASWSPESFWDDGKWFNVAKAVRRGESLKCSLCSLTGATLGCMVSSCRFNYHVPCAAEGTRWKPEDVNPVTGEALSFFCDKHRPKTSAKKGKVIRQGRARRNTGAAADGMWPTEVPIDRNWLLGDRPQTGIGLGTVYCPQVGDTVVYLSQGHEAYLQVFPEPKAPPWQAFHTRFAMVECTVTAVSFTFPSLATTEAVPSVVALVELQVTRAPHMGNSGRVEWHPYMRPTRHSKATALPTFEVSLRNWDGVEFLVLKESVDQAVAVPWRPGLPVASAQMLDNKLTDFHGKVSAVSAPISEDGSDLLTWAGPSFWESIEVAWDSEGNDEDTDRISPWELRPLIANAHPDQATMTPPSVLILPPASAKLLLDAVDSLLAEKDFEPFSQPVDLVANPTYRSYIPLPMDLGTIRRRLANGYYRSLAAVAADGELIALNCGRFNLPESAIVRRAEELSQRLALASTDSCAEWVQCEACDKWRKLPRGRSASDLPVEWYCAMNDWDKSRSTCTAEQENEEDVADASEGSADVGEGPGRRGSSFSQRELPRAQRTTRCAQASLPSDDDDNDDNKAVEKASKRPQRLGASLPVERQTTAGRKRRHVEGTDDDDDIGDDDDDGSGEHSGEDESEEDANDAEEDRASRAKRSTRSRASITTRAVSRVALRPNKASGAGRSSRAASRRCSRPCYREEQEDGSGEVAFQEDSDSEGSLKKKRLIRSRSGAKSPLAPLPRVECPAWPLWEEPGSSLEMRRVVASILAALSKVDEYGTFAEPVRAEDVPGYARVIDRPMDLGTMSGKRYLSLGDFRSDLELVVGNCLTFNSEDSPFFGEAMALAAAAHPAYLEARGLARPAAKIPRGR